jgi:Tfp pilus assembly protein FimV
MHLIVAVKSRVRITAAVATLLIAQQAAALGLGNAKISSDMSAPLNLSIAVVGFSDARIELEELKVDVPSHLDQEALGIPDPIMPNGLKTVVSADGRGGAVVRMSTRTAMREPVLRFALRARWPGGEMVKTYELLIDPPFLAYPRTSTSNAVVVRPPVSKATPRPRPAARVPARAGTSYGPVVNGETLYPIVLAAYPQLTARLVPQVMREIVERNPGAFIADNADGLRRGVVLALPAANEMKQALAGVSQSAPRETASSTTIGTTYRVVKGDTLYGIAQDVLGAVGRQLPAAVARIHARNPQAFYRNDMNRLKVGAVLQLGPEPSSEAGSVATSAILDAVTPVEIQALAPSEITSAALFELTAQLADATQRLAMQQQVKSELNARLNSLSETLVALRERAAQITEQENALRRESTAASTPAVAAPESEPAVSATSEPVRGVATLPAIGVATTGEAEPVRVTPSAPKPDGMSLSETLRSIPQVWIGVAALVLVLLVAFAMIQRRRVTALAVQPRARGADEEKARQKLAYLRELFAQTDKVVAQSLPVSTEDEEPPATIRLTDTTVHMTDTAHAARFAKEAAAHLGNGDPVAARQGIEMAIRLDPHRDEHKMMLATVLENMGEYGEAKRIIREMLDRRDEGGGKPRSHITSI